MATTLGFIVGVLLSVSFIAWMVHLERSYPKKQKPKVIAALETNERLGSSDIDTDFKAVRDRWILLREASKSPARYGVVEYKDRIDAQLEVLAPHNKRLWESMSKGAGPDLSGLANL